MTDAELIAEVARHWRHWSRHLGLDNWRLRFEIADDGRDNPMSIDWTNNYKKPTIFLRPKDHEPDFEEPSFSINVLHEALHLIFYKLKEFGELEMGSSRSSVLWQMFSAAEEEGIDTVVSVIWRLHAETGCKE